MTLTITERMIFFVIGAALIANAILGFRMSVLVDRERAMHKQLQDRVTKLEDEVGLIKFNLEKRLNWLNGATVIPRQPDASAEVEMPPEHGFDKWMVDTLEMRPDYDQVPDPETPPGWIYDGDGPRPVDMPPRIGNREFDNGPDFGNGSWAMKDEDGVWRRYGG